MDGRDWGKKPQRRNGKDTERQRNAQAIGGLLGLMGWKEFRARRSLAPPGGAGLLDWWKPKKSPEVCKDKSGDQIRTSNPTGLSATAVETARKTSVKPTNKAASEAPSEWSTEAESEANGRIDIGVRIVVRITVIGIPVIPPDIYYGRTRLCLRGVTRIRIGDWGRSAHDWWRGDGGHRA